VQENKKVLRIGGIFDKNGKRHQAGGIYDKQGLCPTLDTSSGGYRQPMITIDKLIIDENLVIRKLTPREYARLQGFSDETFNRLKGLSNTQLYKIFGNSITVDVPKKAFLLQALICLPGFTEDHSCVNCENCVHAGNNEFYCDVKFKLLAEKGHSTEEYEEDCEEWELKESIKQVLAIAKAKTEKE